MDYFNSSYWRSRIRFLSLGQRPYWLLAALCCVISLPAVFMLPVLDSTEGKVLAKAVKFNARSLSFSSSRQKSSLREYGINIRVRSFIAGVFGVVKSPVLYRIISLLLAIIGVLSVFYCGKLLFTPEKALVGSLLTCASPLLGFCSVLAVSYIWQFAFSALIMSFMVSIIQINRRNPGEPLSFILSWGFGGIVFAGIFFSGWLVIVPFIGAFLAIAFKDRSIMALRGIILSSIVAMGLGIFVDMQTYEKMPQFWQDLNVFRADQMDIPGLWLWSADSVCIAGLFVGFFAGLFFLFPALLMALRTKMRQQIFLLGWAVGGIAIPAFFLSSPLYFITALPALSLLCADFIMSPVRSAFNIRAKFTGWFFVLLALLVPPFILGRFLWLEYFLTGGVKWPGLVLVILMLGFIVLQVWFALAGARLRLSLVSVLLAVISFVMLSGLILPGVCEFWPGKSISAFTSANEVERSHPVNMVGLNLPSVSFYKWAQVNFSDNLGDASGSFVYNPRMSLVLRQGLANDFSLVMQSWGISVSVVGEVSSYNFAAGKKEKLLIFRRK